MSWSSPATTFAQTSTKKPVNSSSSSSYSVSVSQSSTASAANEEGSGLNRAADQATGDLVLPLVIWNEPPNVEISCLQVLYLPMSQPSQNSNALMNRWPSLASFVQQWNSQSNMKTAAANSSHSMINLKRAMSRRKSKRSSVGSVESIGLDRAGNSKDAIDDEDFQYVDDGDLDGDDELYQLCVFAGTVDGLIVYWLLEQDVVVQVSMLVHPTTVPSADDYREELESGGRSRDGAASPIQSIVSGVDEWGQHNMISVTRDGAIARWELPNGACSRADVQLASQLAPVKGMEMFCNNRYAIVYGEQSRMMVVDTWKMQLLYCVDTSQEQVRRGLATVELKMSQFPIRKTTASTSAATESQIRRASDVGDPTSSSFSTSSSFTSGSIPSSSSSSFTASSSNGGGLPPTFPGTTRGIGAHIWDSLVISLGSEGLVKCFLWSKPRGGAGSSASSLSSGFQYGSYQWVQDSCWVISWADDADDITCSQSTSLKDGDNMNPQTALMRSIKNSYFPRALHVSSDASLVLFIWDSKWVVLKRKWLCDVTPPGAMPARSTPTGGNAGRSASWKYNNNSVKPKSSKYVGSCRISPAELLGGVKAERGCGDVCWEDGRFIDNNQLVLWTNAGHVFKFPVSGDSLSGGGKLFIFTKDQDQLVPRSYHKSLNAVGKGEFVANLHQCDCCQNDHTTASSFRTEQLRERIGRSERFNHTLGYTSCIVASDGETSQDLLRTDSSPSVRLVHACRKGSVGTWVISGSASSSPTKSTSVPSALTKLERVKFHSISDGFAPDLLSAAEVNGPSRASVTHLVLGREGARSSRSTADESSGTKWRRRGSRLRKRSTPMPSPSNPSTTSALAAALGPVSALLPASLGRSRRASTGDSVITTDQAEADYLLDVPVVVRGAVDGSLEFALLGSSRSTRDRLNNQQEGRVRVPCHQAKINAIAHCFWPSSRHTHKEAEVAGPPGLPRSSTTGSQAEGSAQKAAGGKRSTSSKDSCLASDKNPFYRSRFPPASQRRSMSSRHVSIHHPVASTALHSPPAAPTTFSSHIIASHESTGPSLEFVVFSGCTDGVLRISELALSPAEKTSFSLEVTVLQRFKKHVGAIKEVLVSPWVKEDAVCPERYVATVGADNTVNVYAPVYLQNPFTHGPTAAANLPGAKRGKCGIEWECILELGRQPATICSVDWLVDRGQIQVECDDGMVYLWSLDTGVLERAMPCALLYDGGNTQLDRGAAGDDDSHTSVQCSKLSMGDSSVHLIKFDVNQSAEVIKANWKSYYHNLMCVEGFAEAVSPRSSSSPSRGPSPYAVGSIELLLLAFLVSWGAAPDIDRACRDLLGLDAPQALFSCVLMDDASGALSIPLPWKSIFSPLSHAGEERNPYTRKWQHSSALSATVALGLLSLCMNLMEHKYSKADDGTDSDATTTPASPKNKEEFHVLWSQLITQHSVVLPDYVPFFREPSLDLLAKYGFHPNDYTQLAARALLNSAIKRLHPPSRSALCAEYSAKLHCEIVRLETETGGKLNGSSSSSTIDATLIVARLGSLVILLSMIGTCYPGEISPAGAREVCDILVCLLRTSVQHITSVAAELLTKGLMLYRPHLVDLSSLITQLLFIDLREKQRNPGGDSPSFGSNARVLASGGSNAALSLLVELGACESAFVLNLLQQEMNNAERPHAFRECILLYLMELINTHYLLMFRHLPSVVDTVMCCLDPTKPERRKRCLELSTRCLHNLVRRFPMVDFHKETQRLAIGTMEAVIVLYDLRTATKWRVLDGHTSAISAVGFRSDGQIVVSYAAREGSVRWWNSGNAGIFGGMLKMQQSCIKEHKLDVLKSFGGAPSSSGGASGDLKQVIQTCRFQFLVLKDAPSGNNQQGDRKVLRLTREDASQVQFLM